MFIEVAMLTGDSRMSRGLSQRNSVLTSTSRRSCRGEGHEGRTAPVEENSSRWSATASATHRRSRRDVGIAIGSGTDVAIESGISSSSTITRWTWCGSSDCRRRATGRCRGEPRLGDRLQRVRAPACGGNPRSHRHPPVAGDRRRVHVAVDDHRRDQRSQTGERRPLDTCVALNLQPCQSLRRCCFGLGLLSEGYYSVGFSFVSGASQAGSGPTAPAQLDVLARVDSMDRRTRDSVWSINVRQLDAVALS